MRRERRWKDQSPRGVVAVLARTGLAPGRAGKWPVTAAPAALRCRSRSMRTARAIAGAPAGAGRERRDARAPQPDRPWAAASPRVFATMCASSGSRPRWTAVRRLGGRQAPLSRPVVLAMDRGHGARVSQLERALRGRNRLLEDGGRNANGSTPSSARSPNWPSPSPPRGRIAYAAPSPDRRRTRRQLAFSLGQHRAGGRNRRDDRQRACARCGGPLPC